MAFLILPWSNTFHYHACFGLQLLLVPTWLRPFPYHHHLRGSSFILHDIKDLFVKENILFYIILNLCDRFCLLWIFHQIGLSYRNSYLISRSTGKIPYGLKHIICVSPFLVPFLNLCTLKVQLSGEVKFVCAHISEDLTPMIGMDK